MIHVGLLRIQLDFYQNDSLKLKRREMKKILEDLRKRFFVSLVEFDSHEDLERCDFALSVVGRRAEDCRHRLKQIEEYIDENAFARLVDSEIELIAFG